MPVWFMGVWERKPSRELHMRTKTKVFLRISGALSDYRPEDNVG